jgi:hypothetical protein
MIDVLVFASKITRRRVAKLYYGRQIFNLSLRFYNFLLSLFEIIALEHLAFLLAFFNLNLSVSPGKSRWLGDRLLGTGRAMYDPPWPGAISPGTNGWR